MLLFRWVTLYLLGVFAREAPEVFLRVRFSLVEAGKAPWVTRKESILALDCTILLWTISALMALILPREGLDTTSSC